MELFLGDDKIKRGDAFDFTLTKKKPPITI